MNTFLYDIFVRGVFPIIIVGILGYFAKKFLEYKSAYKWRHISSTIVIIIVMFFIYSFYQNIAASYKKQYTPEETSLLGAISFSDFQSSYWLVDSDKIISMPLYLKPNRMASLKIYFDKIPMEMEYKAGSATHKVLINEKNALILKDISTEDLLSDEFKLKAPANQFDEIVYPFKFRVNTKTKIYLYEVQRSFTPMRIFGIMIFISFLYAIFLYILIHLIYSYPKKHSI